MDKIEALYKEQINNCENELYKYLEAIETMVVEALKVHLTLNERRNKLKEYLENETF